MLVLPPLDAARAWLRTADPLPPDPLAHVLAGQLADGSWGPVEDGRRRTLPTLWRASLLGALGLAHGPAWDGAADFLTRHATTVDGVFSRDARPAGVLACYVAVAASTYLAGRRRDLAAPQIDWIIRYQDVRTRGCSLRGEVPVYDPRLAVRYGGCFAETSCLLGVVKAGQALATWRDDDPGPAGPSSAAVTELLAAIRSALLERRLMYAGDGRVLPLGTTPARAQEWLLPTFPLDWHTDLIEVLDLVARTGPLDERMLPALDRLALAELPGGGWPLRRAFWPSGVTPLETRSAHRPSLLVTRRAVTALEGLERHRDAVRGSP